MKDPMASPSTSDDEEEDPSSSSSSQSQEDSGSSQDSEEQTHSSSRRDNAPPDSSITLPAPPPPPEAPRRRRRITYDEQKRRDWNTFLGYLETQKPRLTLSLLHSADVIDFLKYIDGFGKTLIHLQGCPFFGCPDPPIAPCGCPLRQSWGSLDGLVRRLRAACEEAPSHPKINPFGARPVRNYLLHVKDAQATARGIPYSRIRKSRFPPSDDSNAASATFQTPPPPPPPPPPPAHDDQLRVPTPLPGIVPLVGSIGQDAPVQLQLCWVQQPATDNQATPSFYPIWGYPVSFLPTFPCMPIPNPERPKNKKTRVPEQEAESEEDQPETEPLGTGEEEGSSSSNEGGGSEPIQTSAEHPTTSSRRRRRRNTYEEQKGKDWEVFQYFLDNREPRLTLSRVRSTHVIEFLEAIDQYGKTLVHESGCPYFGQPKPAAPCPCPLRQSWGTLDGLVRRLRAACEENPSCPDPNPFGVRAIRDYLLHVKDIQATARGIPYSRKRRRNLPTPDTALTEVPSESTPLGTSTDQRDSSAVDVNAAASSTTNLVGEGPGALLASSSSAPWL